VSELERLEAAVSECREMIREAHAATKDLRAAVREARQEQKASGRRAAARPDTDVVPPGILPGEEEG
jgi:hypothetical protein